MSFKSWLFAFLIVIGMIGIINFASYQALTPAILHQEQQEVQQNLTRSQAILNDDLDNLSTIGADWAFRDDTYRFSQDANSQYIQDNLNNNTLKQLNLNIIYIERLSGEELFAKAIDLSNGQNVDLPSDFRQHFSPDNPIIPALLKNKAISGLLALKEGTFSFIAYPILNSESQGEPHAFIVMGHFSNELLTSKEIPLMGVKASIFNTSMRLFSPELDDQLNQLNAPIIYLPNFLVYSFPN